MTYNYYYMTAIREIMLYRLQIEKLYCYEILDDSVNFKFFQKL